MTSDNSPRTFQQPNDSLPLPPGISSRIVSVRDLDMHILQAGSRSSPLLMLLHGFPELAYSWREVMVPLAELGYHVVAHDHRGFGRTVSRTDATSAPGEFRLVRYEDELHPYRMLNVVHDVVALASALGYKSVACVVGHDYGSFVAGYCAVVRPDIFQRVVFMSGPFPGAPALPFGIATESSEDRPTNASPAAPAASLPPGTLVSYVDAALARLQPPRKHYTHYFSGRTANNDIMNAPQGLSEFIRGYFHLKSADWEKNDPHVLPLPPDPASLEVLPHYYVMPRDATMADVAAAGAPSAEEIATKSHRWFSEEALAVYTQEYGRTGFQGALNRYRSMTAESTTEELGVFSRKSIDVPAMFLSGKKDWGVYQHPGVLQKMPKEVCTRMTEEDIVLIDGAGHWVQQEQPGEVVKHIRAFLERYPIDA